jgi:hypothetical protein
MSLTDWELEHFHREGYVVKSGIFLDSDLQPIRDAISGVVGRTASRLVADGRLDEAFDDLPFETRYAAIRTASADAAVAIRSALTGKSGGGFHEPAMLACLRHPGLVSCVQSIVGPDIVASSVYRVRPKLPGWEVGEVPWHQDSGYLLRHCDKHLIVTCWIPLVDATVDNGCLYVIPRAHRKGVRRHYTGGKAGYLEIPRELLPSTPAVPIEMDAGDVLLMTNLTPHASFANRTNIVRWSLDLRYQGMAVPNNVDEDPATYTPERDPVTMACYPPEADFVIRDTRKPEREVRTAERFYEIRQRYERARPYSPGRGWRPITEHAAL